MLHLKAGFVRQQSPSNPGSCICNRAQAESHGQEKVILNEGLAKCLMMNRYCDKSSILWPGHLVKVVEEVAIK